MGMMIGTVMSLAAVAANWIAGSYEPPAEADAEAFFRDAPNDVLERRFAVRDAEVRRALWRVAAPGMRDLFVNGTRVSATALPPWTPYARRVLEESFDVTALIRPNAENEVRVELGNGWYNPLPLKFWYACNLRDALSVGTPCVRATLEIVFADGSAERIVTDGSWRAARGQRLRNSIYLGEKVDLRRAVTPDRAARVVTGPSGAVVPAGGFPKTVVYDRWTARAVTAVSNGVWLVDMGVNFAGTYRVTLRRTAEGQVVRFRLGERMHPDGSVNVLTAVAGQVKDRDRGPLFGVAEQGETVICKAADELVFEPRFAFHVFRYLQVEGLVAPPRPEDFTALAWSADVKDRSSFACSDERLNRLHEVCRRTFRSNLQSVQSDCPGREKFGYGGDIACTAESFWFNYDMREFYRKVVRDFLDEAEKDGVFTETAPYVGIGDRGVFPAEGRNGRRSAPMGWAVGVPVLLDTLVRHAGDLEILREAYPALTRYIRLVRQRHPENDIPGCLGDWVPAADSEKADERMSALAHWHQFVALTAKFARLLDKPDDARRYGTLAGAVADRFRRAFVSSGVVCRGTQGDQLFGLYHGLLEAADVRPAYARLKGDIVSRGDSLTTGIFATRYLLEVLPAFGDWELAGKVVTHKGHPGWLDMLDRGATTLWEHWDEGQCLDVYSNCHPMFGSVDGWLFENVLGVSVRPDAVGCDKVSIAPRPPADLDWASGWLDTPHGRITVSWRKVDGKIRLEKTLPPGIELVESW